MDNQIVSIYHFTASSLAALLLNISSGSTALAQEQSIPNQSGHWGIGFSLSSVGFDSEKAELEGVKTQALGLGIKGNYWTSKTVLSLGIDYYIYSDNTSFKQKTTQGTKKSDASALGLIAAFGPYLTLGPEKNNIIYTQIGFNQIVESERSVSYCSDCYSENIDLDADVFLKAGFFHAFGNNQLGIEATQYLTSDDYTNAIGLTWGIHY